MNCHIHISVSQRTPHGLIYWGGGGGGGELLFFIINSYQYRQLNINLVPRYCDHD